MSKDSSILNRAKRLDRLMTWVISLGGMLIIVTVLGILVFIARETLPLFRAVRSQSVAMLQIHSTSDLQLDESGKAAMMLDPAVGIRAFDLPAGKAIQDLTDGPEKPWKLHSPLGPQGHVAVVGRDGHLSVGQVKWDKPSGEANPHHWSPTVAWQGNLPGGANLSALLHVRECVSEGLGGGSRLRLAALDADGRLVWTEFGEETKPPLIWKALPSNEGRPTAAIWSADGHQLYVGYASGSLALFEVGDEIRSTASIHLEGGISALGFVLGQTTLLVGDDKGHILASQVLRKEGEQTFQVFHHFKPMKGRILGFVPSLRDKRFLAWSDSMVVVDHLTTEKRLFSQLGSNFQYATLAPRGDFILAGSPSGLQSWTLDAPHPEISAKTLWGKVHYESYDKPEYVWQSTGGTDDFEPKLSLVPLLFGTLKGTLYAMLFALPLAIFGALYTSQFATPRLRNTIKPLVEVMAALPSVVLGFVAGLVLAPLFERAAIQVLLLPLCTLLVATVILPVWARLPRRFHNAWGHGREAIWLVPVLLLGLALALSIAPTFEHLFLMGDFRTWLLQKHAITYDQRNSLVVGFAMGFAVIPIIFTISEDALTSVPRSLTSASLACGASPWQTAWRVVLPTASPGIFSAVMVGFGRAIGETMIVLMATGNTPLLDWSPFNGMRTLAANIAVETPEAPVHGTLYRVLFFTALLLFALTFLLNTVAELVRQHLRKRYESF